MNTHITGNVKYYSQTQNKSFIEELRKNPPLTKEEELTLFTKLSEGDESVVNEIAKKNQRWVYSMAKEYARDEVEVMDYVQEGNIGLIEAIYSFDLSRDTKFITHAVWLIRQKMNAFMNGDRDIITKSNNAKLCKKIERVKSKYFAENGYLPTLDEIKDAILDIYGIKVVDKADLYDLELLSVNDSVGDNSTTVEDSDDFVGATYSDNIATTDEDREYDKRLALAVINHLPEPEQREFIKKLYHIGYDETYTVSKLCEEYGKDEAWVKKTENDIIDYMRKKVDIKEVRKAV